MNLKPINRIYSVKGWRAYFAFKDLILILALLVFLLFVNQYLIFGITIFFFYYIFTKNRVYYVSKEIICVITFLGTKKIGLNKISLIRNQGLFVESGWRIDFEVNEIKYSLFLEDREAVKQLLVFLSENGVVKQKLHWRSFDGDDFDINQFYNNQVLK